MGLVVGSEHIVFGEIYKLEPAVCGSLSKHDKKPTAIDVLDHPEACISPEKDDGDDTGKCARSEEPTE